MKQAVIALGSNVGDTLANLRAAVDLLEQGGCEIRRISSLYITEPWGYADQDDFLNGAVLIATDKDPHELLMLTQSIERELGRKKLFVNGPRNIDLDILVYEGETVATETLTLPHPRIKERLFVLTPFHDVAPDWDIPGMGKVAALFCAFAGEERVEPTKKKIR
ncbi:MAG TPA: 2-amino-4-hydroxy-6-hydroxymethyldihydropteridine diphosphokinase [Clostridiales bacterium]|nr:2-amino-4-hydroxy-6-hydroxymethyldihydropteridine diphosphokinase [Clostridiales bacterium]